ncbi:MAG TPA: tetratricopeptide repeat protein [Pyrinomonadaceae bacterium]|nr:tetratricopeptide repeat protein [Pyrinomonadaceae bacterium]
MTLLALAVASAAACFVFGARRWAAAADEGAANPSAGDEVAREINAALYTRAEFFGAQARVPYPTAEARNRLAAVSGRRPKEPRVTLALARLDEKLGRYELAEEETREFVAESGGRLDALEELAAFQHRRALFDREATTLELMLKDAPDEARASLLERLVRLAESQKLDAYLRPEFFERVIGEHPEDFRVVADYVGRLAGRKETAAALDAVRRYRERFPSRRRFFMEQEVALLDAAGRAREAEAVYVNNFDPFWPDTLSERFYDFLREHDRYRAYGGELREAFRRDPSDFRLAVRLFHFRKHAYEGSDDIFTRLEAARADARVEWRAEELATAARLLIKEGDADTASRFLYTLVARGQFAKGSPERARILYQLFELLSDAGDERLPLTRGDLRFYREVASSDPHPGMLGGVLSLVFSGENPARELKEEDEAAVKFFNRAAAYRVFNAYKEENPTSPELAQMYLDLVRLYSAEKEPKVAAGALAEFEQRYGDAPQYAEVALKLADCYLLLGRHDEERAVYGRVLDYLGRHREGKSPLVPSSTQDALSEPTAVSPALVEYPPKRSNPGIRAGEDEKSTSDYYSHYYYESPSYRDFLASPEEQQSDAEGESDDEAAGAVEEESDDATVPPVKVTYADVLARYVASLAKENRTEDVLALYAGEIRKHPEEQGLYEQMLQWLGQTNLFEEQSRVYREALGRFPGETWRDRLARWLLRRERGKEFEDFSRELVGKLDDQQAERYLEQFIDAKAGAAGTEANLYLGLYSLAHERFPEDIGLVRGLLKFYAAHERWDDYRRLLAEYYFVSTEVREQFLSHLSERGELRARLDEARAVLKKHNGADAAEPSADSLPYKLFRADAAARLSNYEEALDAYRELNRLYPSTPEFAGRLVAFTRSLGQRNRVMLEEAAAGSRELADANPSDADCRTRAGEVFAELGDFARARAEWSRLVSLAPGDDEAYLNAATVFWDYFQYGDALEIIQRLRRETGERSVYAFEAGAILEAQHRLPEAVAEYVRALDENAPAHARAQKRLAVLFKRPGVPELTAAAYARARPDNSSGVTLGYFALLKEVGRRPEASRVLAAEVARSVDADFIESARERFSEADDDAGERACLVRLTQVSNGPRQFISHSLQLADSYGRRGEQQSAAAVVRGLLRKFPANYGVLQEASNVYARLGLADESVQVLRRAASRGRGHYRVEFSRRLAARLLELNREAEARSVLERLHAEDPLDLGAFRELARLYARAGQGAALKTAFGRTLDAVRSTDADPRELRGQVADLRRAMIEVFTALRDYRAAMEQHVEIVNRDPDDDAAVEAAISYAKRYGGAEELLAYYQKTAAQAYKNYRWNVVLARIYEAKGDLASSARSYTDAIANQPEMAELHASLAEVYVKARDYERAVGALERASELSNDDPQYVRRTAEVLEMAGRIQEAAAARAKLPGTDAPKREGARELFAEAGRALDADRAKAVEQYREAFAKLEEDPYKQDLRASEINDYVRAVRDADGLDVIFERLWRFRERLLADADRREGKDAGRARSLLSVLDGALPDAVGATAAEVATGDELAPLFRSLREKADGALRDRDAHGTLALLQNTSHRAGFNALEERVLVAQKDAARASSDPSTFHARLRALANFYAEGGEYARAVELLESEGRADSARDDFDYAALLAEYSRLSGDGARELSALRNNYERAVRGPVSQTDQLVGRYLELLYESGQQGREELARRAQEGASAHLLQLVNFLITKGERGLAHTAVAGAALPAEWKLARQAQLSLALGEFDAGGEAYFDAALKHASIGELIKNKDGARLTGEDWSRLDADYGRWLYLSGDSGKRAGAAAALPAVVEARPRDPVAQRELARWYLARGDARDALEHLNIADEESPDDDRTLADLGSAHFLLGERRQAEAFWARIIEGEEPTTEACVLYLKTLAGHGLAREARDRLAPLVAKRLKEAADSYSDTKFEELKPLLAALSSSFGGAAAEDSQNAAADDEGAKPLSSAEESERAALFLKLCGAAPDDTKLAQLIVEEGLVGRARLGDFYALLVARSQGPQRYDYDYEYTDFTRNVFGAGGADEAFDHANAFKAEEPSNERVKWQRQYLEYLLEEGRDAEASKVVNAVEDELVRRYARPAWLRLAKARLELRGGRREKALAELKAFVGADVPPGLAKISAPSAGRLSDAVALLRQERCESLAPQLIEATYTQLLALGQYQTPYFVALARVAFEGGDPERGDGLLRLLVDLSSDETRDEAAARVATLPGVSERAAALERAELPEEVNSISRADALALAAETVGSFARYEESIGFRQTLAAERSEDYTNRVELARVLAAAGRRTEAVAQLSGVVYDRRAPRAARWQAVWVAPEVTGGSAALWESLVRSSVGRDDREMSAALDARKLWAEGHAGEAADLLERAAGDDPNPLLEFFLGAVAADCGRSGVAEAALAAAFRSRAEDDITSAFGADREGALGELIRLQLSSGRASAALKFASLDAELVKVSSAEGAGGDAGEEASDANAFETRPGPNYRTLKERAEARRAASESELLAGLSAAAEQLGDFDKALEFERARQGRLPDEAERAASQARVTRLARLRKQAAGGAKPPLVVDGTLVAKS